MENEVLEYELKSEDRIYMYFLRYLWIFILWIITSVGMYLYANLEFDICTLYVIALFIVFFLIYLYISVNSYKKNTAKVCILYMESLLYKNPFGKRSEKEVTYQNIIRIEVQRNILDLIFKTAKIIFVKAVEYDEGTCISIVNNYKPKVEKIHLLIGV